jgi:hypothetical protein
MSGLAHSAFSAGSSNRRANVNLNSGGGSKKQGLCSSVGLDNWSIRQVQTHAVGTNVGRKTIFTINQLGGIGAGRSMFNTATSAAKPDGVHKRAAYFMK